MIDNTCYGVYTERNDKNIPQAIAPHSAICGSEFVPKDGRITSNSKGVK